MSKKVLVFAALLLSLTLGGCAQFQRGWSSFWATTTGSNWIVVQFDNNGKPFNCWKLVGASVSSEKASDGIFWQDPASGTLVHISGWYNYVQVEGKNFAVAAEQVGIDENKCRKGKYPN